VKLDPSSFTPSSMDGAKAQRIVAERASFLL